MCPLFGGQAQGSRRWTERALKLEYAISRVVDARHGAWVLRGSGVLHVVCHGQTIDVPVLARAEVGIAACTCTDVAVKSAEVVLT